jgi:hypothetical protein
MTGKFIKLARSITQEYIEKYGMELSKIDELDLMIANALNKVDSESWHDGYKAAKEDFGNYE